MVSFVQLPQKSSFKLKCYINFTIYILYLCIWLMEVFITNVWLIFAMHRCECNEYKNVNNIFCWIHIYFLRKVVFKLCISLSCGGRLIGGTSKVCLFSCFDRQGVISLPLNFFPVHGALFELANASYVHRFDSVVNNRKKENKLCFCSIRFAFSFFSFLIEWFFKRFYMHEGTETKKYDNQIYINLYMTKGTNTRNNE